MALVHSAHTVGVISDAGPTEGERAENDKMLQVLSLRSHSADLTRHHLSPLEFSWLALPVPSIPVHAHVSRHARNRAQISVCCALSRAAKSIC